jgi:hypothetical protein
LPEIKDLFPDLISEFPVYGFDMLENKDLITMGIVDAMTISDKEKSNVVIDWKSDFSPTEDTIEDYRLQVSNYLDLTGAQKGLIVTLTAGGVIEV